jgi:hypothetical protein
VKKKVDYQKVLIGVRKAGGDPQMGKAGGDPRLSGKPGPWSRQDTLKFGLNV